MLFHLLLLPLPAKFFLHLFLVCCLTCTLCLFRLTNEVSLQASKQIPPSRTLDVTKRFPLTVCRCGSAEIQWGKPILPTLDVQIAKLCTVIRQVIAFAARSSSRENNLDLDMSLFSKLPHLLTGRPFTSHLFLRLLEAVSPVLLELNIPVELLAVVQLSCLTVTIQRNKVIIKDTLYLFYTTCLSCPRTHTWANNVNTLAELNFLFAAVVGSSSTHLTTPCKPTSIMTFHTLLCRLHSEWFHCFQTFREHLTLSWQYIIIFTD